MNRHQIIALIIITQAATGCSVLKLHPDPPPEDEIKVTWEDSGNDQLVVKYSTTRKKRGESSSGKVQQAPPSKYILDTVSSDHAALLLEINSWLGTPYGYGRSEKKRGTDCSGLTMEIYNTVYGIKLNRSSEGQVSNTAEISKEQLEIGDLVFFETRGSRVSHVGIYIGNNKFVHSSTQRGVVINDLNEKYYREKYVRSGRVLK